MTGTGDIQVDEDLLKEFGAGSAPPDPYKHKEEEKILDEAKDMLREITEGKRLVELMAQYNIPAHVIKGKEITYNCPDEKTIYLIAPPAWKKDIAVCAMALACGIRDVEQYIVGFRRPDPDADPADFAQMTFTKSVDIIATMCKIGDELHKKFGVTNVLDTIAELGHSEVYMAYKDNVSYNEFSDLFVKGELDAMEDGDIE